MLKALIIAADSVEPSIIFGQSELFPNLKQMMEQGSSASYSAYVQKGYTGSYSSEQNWASIYTGLSPKEHGINTRQVRGESRRPQMKDFDGLQPFWQICNIHGLKVGLWAADNCVSPTPIDGYAVSAKYEMIDTPVENRISPRELQVCEKDRSILSFFDGAPPERIYPKTLAQQGYTFEQLKQNPDLAEKAVERYHFQEAVSNFETELSYWFNAIRKTQRQNPVDVLYLYTPTTDLIAHCCMCNDSNPVLIQTYQLLDRFIGQLVRNLNPEITIFLSDHGQQNFKDLVPCSNPIVQREAFSAREDVLWLKNGYIAFEAYNGALLFTAHALKGTFIAKGVGIRHTSVCEMRTLDIYPTVLEMFGLPVPESRSGYVMDIFSRPVINFQKLLQPEKIIRRSIALLQTHEVSWMDIIINELYIENRFADITLVGEEKYREIFLGNPRISEFMPFEQFHADYFDAVYCGVCNQDSKLMRHIKITEKNQYSEINS